MNPDLLTAARAAFPATGPAVVLGAPLHEGAAHPEPLVRLPLRMMNRHGLIAGATGTGKTKTLQAMAEQLSTAGVPVFVSDVKGDLGGLAAPGEPGERVAARARETGWPWRGLGWPVEFLSLTGRLGAALRATVSSFGPLALAKVLGLNDTQTSVLTLVFKYCDDRGLPLLDFADLRAVLQHLTGPGAAELADLGAVPKASVGVLLRELVELEAQGADDFFGEPEFELDDLLRTAADGRGLISVLSLQDVQDRPALSSTFMMWLLARLYNELPEVGDLERPKLVFFFDEAHLLFKNASRAFVEQVEHVVRLVRSKGVGVFFVTQSPKDLPPSVLGQLGNRVQHALRAFTPDDEKSLRAVARTFPKSRFYDVQEALTTLGTGEALVSVLTESGAPTPPFATRIVPPWSRMGPLTPDERAPFLATEQARRYARPVDRESAHEILARRMAREEEPEPPPPRRGRTPKAAPSVTEQILASRTTQTVVREVTRGLLGALLGKPPRRRRARGPFGF